MKDKRLPEWFAGGEMNTCYAAVDHHIAQGRGDQTAFVRVS